MRPELREAAERGHARGLAVSLAPPTRTPAGASGERLGNRVGSSVEFMDFREYAPGDDLRRLDWAAYARTDRLMTRLYREEVTPHCDLLVDATASMDLAGTPKAAAAMGLAGLLAGAAESSRWSTRLFAIDAPTEGAVGREVPGGNAVPAAWQWPGFEGAAESADRRPKPPESPTVRGALRLKRQAMRILLTDLLFEADAEAVAARFADGAAGFTVIQLLSRRDADPGSEGAGDSRGFAGDVRLRDAETGGVREARLDGAALRAYRDALAAHTATWANALGRVDGRLVTVIAEDVIAGGATRTLIERGVLR